MELPFAKMRRTAGEEDWVGNSGFFFGSDKSGMFITQPSGASEQTDI